MRNVEKQKQYARAYLERNRVVHQERTRKRYLRLRCWLWEFKKTLSCIRCGEDHPACLVFHHREGELKLFEISLGPSRGFATQRMLAEIAKCDVLCANCHAKHHFSRGES